MEEKTPLQTLSGAGLIHLPLLAAHERRWPTASTFFKGEQTQGTHFPLLITEVRGRVTKRYIHPAHDLTFHFISVMLYGLGAGAAQFLPEASPLVVAPVRLRDVFDPPGRLPIISLNTSVLWTALLPTCRPSSS